MRRERSIWILSTVLAFAGLTAPMLAQSPAKSSPSEARIQELIRVAAERVAQGQVNTPAQTPSTPAAPDNRPVLRLSLDDAVKLALDHNLDIAVQRLNPQINDIQIASLRSIYRPTLTSQIFNRSTANPATSTIAGAQVAGASVDSNLTTYNAGIAQSMFWGGGNLAIQLNNNRQFSTAQTSLYNPQYNTNWSGQYTQPILRGFKIDNNRQQLAVTKITRDISDVQLKASITNTLSNVRNAYWDYVYAIQAVDVSRSSLDLANRLVQDNQTRVQVGTMAPIDVVQARAQAATAEQNLVTAQATQRTTELALKRLIVGGTDDPNWNVSVDPVDRPDFRPVEIDLEGAIRRALSERTDVDIAKKSVAANDVTLKYLNDQTLPQADLQATYGLIGLGGTQLLTEGQGVNRVPVGTIPGGYLDALSTLFHTNYPTWTVQMNFSFPLGLSAQQAAVQRAKVQLNQVEAQLKQIELQVATEVTNAAINVRNTAEFVQAAQAARDLSQQQLDAENSKFEVGMSTNYFVVQAQNQLATNQNNELRAVLNYRKALVELERVQATTLQSANITILGR